MKVRDMKPGDIFECAYGHEDNIITGVFESAEPDGGWTKIQFRFMGGKSKTMYDSRDYENAELEVIGHVQSQEGGED